MTSQLLFAQRYDPVHVFTALNTEVPEPVGRVLEGADRAIAKIRGGEPILEHAAFLLNAGAYAPVRTLVEREGFGAAEGFWHKRAHEMPPLYITDHCVDDCGYLCAFRRSQKDLVRHRLTLEQILEQWRQLKELGYRSVELVAGTDPYYLEVENLCEVIRMLVADGAQAVLVNVLPYETEAEYCKLREAGCAGVIVWMETYHYAKFSTMHHGPKRDMHRRLNGNDLALRAGIPTAGNAFLGRLYDWRFDALSTMLHTTHLRETYGANSIFGLPRNHAPEWFDNEIAYEPFSFGDPMYLYVSALYSLVFPDALVWSSTREQLAHSIAALRGGGMITLDCSTRVGGYGEEQAGRGDVDQFHVNSYKRDAAETVVREGGLIPTADFPWTLGAAA